MPSFMLELISVETNEKIICYFNARKTKSGYAVKAKSKFANLYRITAGNNPMPRYNKAQQLLKHLIGYYFIAEYESVTASNQSYLKATSIKPNEPKLSEHWKEDGELLGKYDWRKKPPKQSKKWKVTGKRLESDWKVNGKLLESEITGKAHFYLVSSGFSVRNNVTTYIREHVTTGHVSTPNIKPVDKYKTTAKKIEGAKHYQYHQRPDETEHQFQERVIDESMDV